MGHLAHHGEDRALGRVADGGVGAVGRAGHGGADEDGVDELPGREASSSAAPRISWERITPLLPRAPSSAARATPSTISSRPIVSISPLSARRSSSSSTARSVSAMLSPVSPSATGNTFRSLTSSRRASSSASERWTTARNRTRDGSAKVAGRLGLGDLARLEAARADVDALRARPPRRCGPSAGSRRSAAWWRPWSGSGSGRRPGAFRRSDRHGPLRRRRIAGRAGGYGGRVPQATARITLPARYRLVRHIANGGMAERVGGARRAARPPRGDQGAGRAPRRGRARAAPLRPRGADRRRPLRAPPRRDGLRRRGARRARVHRHGAADRGDRRGPDRVRRADRARAGARLAGRRRHRARRGARRRDRPSRRQAGEPAAGRPRPGRDRGLRHRPTRARGPDHADRPGARDGGVHRARAGGRRRGDAGLRPLLARRGGLSSC